MKRGWKRFWPFVSVPAATLFTLPLLVSAGSKELREKSLAGLKPGKDTLQNAIRRFGPSNDAAQSDPPRFVVWRDVCNHQQVLVAMDESGLIRAVVVEQELAIATSDCTPGSYARKVRERFGSGRGLLYGDHCERIQELYGTAQSKASSNEGGKQIESYAYTFESNSKSPALRLEVSCNTTSNLVNKLRLETVGAPAK